MLSFLHSLLARLEKHKYYLAYPMLGALLFFQTSLQAQSSKIDSLTTSYAQTKSPITAIILAKEWITANPDSSQYYLNKVNQDSLEKKWAYEFKLAKSDLLQKKQLYDSAVTILTSLLKDLGESPQYILEANTNDRIGSIYLQLREKGQALSYFEEAINIRIEHNLTEELPKSYYGLGNIEFRDQKHVKAISNYKKGIINIDSTGQVSLLANLNYMMGNSYNFLRKTDSAVYHFQNAKKIYEDIGASQSIFLVSQELANALIIQNKYSEAIPILERNLDIISDFNSWQYYNRTYRLLVDAYEGAGDFRKALFYMKNKYDTAIKVLTNNKTQSVAKITEDFRTTKGLDEAEEQAFFATQKAKTLGIVVAILIVLMLISYLLFNRAIQKKKLESLQAMVLGEENERKRVAKDLHDGIGVLLTSVKLRLSNFQDKVEAKEDFKNSLEQIDNACTEVRRISHNMVPASLTKLGLQEAILDLLDNVRASTDILIEEALDYKEGAYDESKEVLIYRVVQELINNSLKYAAPKKVSVSISKSKQDYLLTYKDDGKGFEKSKVKFGLGLRSIASRVDILKGKFTYESTPGEGAIFNITIPHYG